MPMSHGRLYSPLFVGLLAILGGLMPIATGVSAVHPPLSPENPPSKLGLAYESHLDKRLDISSILGSLEGMLVGNRDPASVANVLKSLKPQRKPSGMQDISDSMKALYSRQPQKIFQGIGGQIVAGLVGPGDLSAILQGLNSGENSQNNTNDKNPAASIYPAKNKEDAIYTLKEEDLRAAIYIPPTFTYGQKPPVLFIPGTGSYGGITYQNNLRKIISDTDYADPVWINVPGALLGNSQTNGEYAAYAINYINGITNRNLSVISWSQGGLNTQFAFTYWPSTRAVVSDFLAISPDFHGTVMANVLCLNPDIGVGAIPCAPSVLQQEYTSKFIAQLRSDGGDSAYVPTTTFYSGFIDEIVQPQTGTGASGYLKDDRGVGCTNVEVTKECDNHYFYEHAGVIAHPLTAALVVDALTHDGPGDLQRINVADVCSTYAPPQLNTDDVLNTVGLIPIAGYFLLTAPDKAYVEPELIMYQTGMGSAGPHRVATGDVANSGVPGKGRGKSWVDMLIMVAVVTSTFWGLSIW